MEAFAFLKAGTGASMARTPRTDLQFVMSEGEPYTLNAKPSSKESEDDVASGSCLRHDSARLLLCLPHASPSVKHPTSVAWMSENVEVSQN